MSIYACAPQRVRWSTSLCPRGEGVETFMSYVPGILKCLGLHRA